MNAVPIREALGRTVRCPDEGCGRPSKVLASRHQAATPGGVPPPPWKTPTPGGAPAVSTNKLWYLLHCPRTGPKLLRHDTMVELADDGG